MLLTALHLEKQQRSARTATSYAGTITKEFYMNIAVISNGTFSEEYYKEYFSSCEDTKLICVCSTDDELPEGKYDVIAVDYYNESLNPHSIDKFADNHTESIVVVLADFDFEGEFKQEEKILKKFSIDYVTCFNIKDERNSAKDFYDFAKSMIDIKNEDENAEAPISISVCLWVLAIVALIILGLIHYLH